MDNWIKFSEQLPKEGQLIQWREPLYRISTQIVQYYAHPIFDPFFIAEGYEWLAIDLKT